MSAWSERVAVANLWIDARRGGSLAFRVLTRIQKVHTALRATAKSAYLAWQKSNWSKSRKR